MRRWGIIVALCCTMVILWLKWEDIVRPAGVPRGAVRVFFSKEGGWAHCWLDAEQSLNRCRTYNALGERMYRVRRKNDPDDVFLRYRGTGPVPERELRIDTARTQIDFVWLRNGVILLPRNDFETQKAWIDKIMALR